jgi:hypothetical protein
MTCGCGQGCGATAHGGVTAGTDVNPVVDERLGGVVDTDCAATGKGSVTNWFAAEVLGDAGVEALGVFELGGVGLLAFFFDG